VGSGGSWWAGSSTESGIGALPLMRWPDRSCALGRRRVTSVAGSYGSGCGASPNPLGGAGVGPNIPVDDAGGWAEDGEKAVAGGANGDEGGANGDGGAGGGAIAGGFTGGADIGDGFAPGIPVGGSIGAVPAGGSIGAVLIGCDMGAVPIGGGDIGGVLTGGGPDIDGDVPIDGGIPTGGMSEGGEGIGGEDSGGDIGALPGGGPTEAEPIAGADAADVDGPAGDAVAGGGATGPEAGGGNGASAGAGTYGSGAGGYGSGAGAYGWPCCCGKIGGGAPPGPLGAPTGPVGGPIGPVGSTAAEARATGTEALARTAPWGDCRGEVGSGSSWCWLGQGASGGAPNSADVSAGSGLACLGPSDVMRASSSGTPSRRSRSRPGATRPTVPARAA
jgi:hypothetical protein